MNDTLLPPRSVVHLLQGQGGAGCASSRNGLEDSKGGRSREELEAVIPACHSTSRLTDPEVLHMHQMYRKESIHARRYLVDDVYLCCGVVHSL